MVFLSVCTALYDYSPRAEGELAISEGDLVYVLEKGSEDDWWKAKKKAAGEDEDEPVGLIPNNYVEEARPIHRAKALYDYSRQTDEELSFSEDSALTVYDTSDPDWTLVGLNGEFGFAPANYIELTRTFDQQDSQQEGVSSDLPARPPTKRPSYEDVGRLNLAKPAANIASIIGQQDKTATERRLSQLTPETSDNEEPIPSLPQRPQSHQLHTTSNRQPSPPVHEPAGVLASPPMNRVARCQSDAGPASPGGFHLYNVNEMVSIMGKQKKMPTTLGINLATGVILIIPEKKRDGPQQEWVADKLMHYSIEGKHVFMELVKPSKSIDFHAGAKDTASEIVASLGELAGAARAEGLREVIAAGTGGQKQGRMLYDFMAQGDDEVTVADGDDVIIIDNTQSKEWWKVRRIKNGKEGVVPSSYVEVQKISPLAVAASDTSNLNAGLSTIEQNRLEEQKLARESMQESLKTTQRQEEHDLVKSREVGPGLRLPHRASSLISGHHDDKVSPQRSKRNGPTDGRSQSVKSKPDSSRIRTWTDRSGSFKVDAQFIGLKDGKIHLHKVNGVKIAVPVAKMATVDLEYVETVTGHSLDEDKPLSDLVKRGSRVSNGKAPSPTRAAATRPPAKPDYDWFDFFLKCGVSPYQCERYGYNFNKDSMDESILPEITPSVLRNLGLKEGDVLRVMKYLDDKYARSGSKQKNRNVSFGGEEVIGQDEAATNGASSPGGLFSGPGGALRNNTRKSRPAPAVQTNNVVDSQNLVQSTGEPLSKSSAKEGAESPDTPGPVPPAKDNVGFEDDAWDMKPSQSKIMPQAPAQGVSSAGSAMAVPSPPPTALTGSMAELSLLSQPLQPTVTHKTGAQSPGSQDSRLLQSVPSVQQPSLAQSSNQQHQGATPQFFSQLSHQQTASPQALHNAGAQLQQQLPLQPTVQPQFTSGARQRPQAPHISQQGGLMPPPPVRPLSAPQNVTAQGNFGPPPLQPQLTGALNSPNIQSQSQIAVPLPEDVNQFQPQQTRQASPMQQQLIGGYSLQNVPATRFNNDFSPAGAGLNQSQPLHPQVTGVHQFGLNSQYGGSFFNNHPLQPQITDMQHGYNTYGSISFSAQQPGSINSSLPAPLQPHNTSANGLAVQGTSQSISAVPPQSQQFAQQISPPPPVPFQQPSVAPLQPQKTGPAPAVRFGVGPEAKKLMTQPTGRRANLAQATPENPFGF